MVAQASQSIQENRQKLYDALTKNNFDVGDFDYFNKKLEDPESRFKLFNAVQEHGFDIGSYDEYEKRIAGDFLVSQSGTSKRDEQEEIKKSIMEGVNLYKEGIEDPSFLDLMSQKKTEEQIQKDRTKLKTFINTAFVQPYYNILSGMTGATASITDVLDTYAKKISDTLGVSYGGAFRDLSNFYASQRDIWREKGIPEQEGFIDDLSRALYGGTGNLLINLPTISITGLPGYSAAVGGAEAIKEGRSMLEGMAAGGIQGTAMKYTLGALGRLPAGVAEIAGGSVFGGITMLQELQKPADEVDWSAVVSDFLLGTVLTWKGGRKSIKQQLIETINNRMTDQKRFDKWAKRNGIPKETAQRLYKYLKAAENEQLELFPPEIRDRIIKGQQLELPLEVKYKGKKTGTQLEMFDLGGDKRIYPEQIKSFEDFVRVGNYKVTKLNKEALKLKYEAFKSIAKGEQLELPLEVEKEVKVIVRPKGKRKPYERTKVVREPYKPLKTEGFEFIGFQKDAEGNKIPLFNITDKNSPSYGSTVGTRSLRKLGYKVPNISELKTKDVKAPAQLQLFPEAAYSTRAGAQLELFQDYPVVKDATVPLEKGEAEKIIVNQAIDRIWKPD